MYPWYDENALENLIQLQQGSKSYGAKLLFDEASFAINEGEHVGVIGPNGAGKTTLFRVLTQQESLDQGQIIRSRRLKVGYLSQHDLWEDGETIEDFISRDSELPIWELKSLGLALGLNDELYPRVITSLSGGYRMRAKLLKLLGNQPNLMLLDEPTNYLDLETVMVLEKFLQNYTGSFLLISHDREFLKRTTDHTLEVESGSITKYNGDIDDYFEQKEMLRTQLEARAFTLEQKKKHILDFVARFGAKASKASQAQSKLKTVEKMEKIEVRPVPITARIRIPPPHRTGKLVMTLKGVNLGYDDRTILSGVDLQLAAGDHLAVVGLNGAGKSTLLKALAGKLKPKAGSIELGFEVTIAYFAQHVAEELDPEENVLEALLRKAHNSVLPQQVKDLAGSLLFSGDDIYKEVKVLSGGERSRVALGQVLLQKASCLILDEPTNHLDFQTVEAMTQALQAFSGSIVIVSHDRGFTRRIGTKILEINHGRAGTYPGTYDEYVWSLERGAYATLKGTTKQAAPAPRASQSEAKPEHSGENYKEKKKALDRRLRQLDQIIADADKKLARLHEKLAAINQELIANTGGPGKIKEMGQVQHEVDNLEATWLASADEREQITKELKELTGT